MQDTIPLLHTINPACKRVGLGRTKFYELIGRGEIKVIKVGSRTLIPESELQRWLSRKMRAV